MRKQDLPAVRTLLADDGLGKFCEDVHDSVHYDYLHALHGASSELNHFLAHFSRNTEILGCLQLSFIPRMYVAGSCKPRQKAPSYQAHREARGMGKKCTPEQFKSTKNGDAL